MRSTQRETNESPLRILKPAAKGNALSDFLYQRGYLEGALSDVAVQAFGKTYRLHRLILDQSPFFSRLLSQRWRDPDGNADADADANANAAPVELLLSDGISQAAFELALARLYGHVDRAGEERHALPLLGAAAYLAIHDLSESCLATIVRALSFDTLGATLAFAAERNYGDVSTRLDAACRALLFRDGYDRGVAAWDDIPLPTIAAVLASDAFWVPGEWERYRFLAALHRRRLERQLAVDALHPVLDALYYMHMSFEQLCAVAADALVAQTTLHAALWHQILLRRRILAADPALPGVGMCSATPGPYPIPVEASADDDDGTAGAPVAYADLAPLRFSVAFENFKAAEPGRRIYSPTVFYAGSFWNVYVQKIQGPRRNAFLHGIYLHRAKAGDGGSLSSSSSLLPSMGLETGLEKSLGKLAIPDDEPPLDAAEAEAVLPPYLDRRPTISSYFSIHCASARGRPALREFASPPDVFNYSQSWGWKSQSLAAAAAADDDGWLEEPAGRDVLKVMVVLGTV